MPLRYRKTHPVLAGTFDCATALAFAVVTAELLIGCAQGVAWLIGQVL